MKILSFLAEKRQKLLTFLFLVLIYSTRISTCAMIKRRKKYPVNRPLGVYLTLAINHTHTHRVHIKVIGGNNHDRRKRKSIATEKSILNVHFLKNQF